MEDKAVFSLDVENFLDSKSFDKMDKDNVFDIAQNLLKNMPKGTLDNMQKMFENLDEDKKQDLMKKAKELGLL